MIIISCNQSGKQETPSDKLDNTLAPVPGTDNASTVSNTPVIKDSLENIWVLDSLNGKHVNQKDFDNGSPYIEPNLTKKTIEGHTGCSGFKGLLVVANNKFSVDSLDVAKMPCKKTSFHTVFIVLLKKGKIPYEVKNGNLFINAGKGANFVFRPIRR